MKKYIDEYKAQVKYLDFEQIKALEEVFDVITINKLKKIHLKNSENIEIIKKTEQGTHLIDYIYKEQTLRLLANRD